MRLAGAGQAVALAAALFFVPFSDVSVAAEVVAADAPTRSDGRFTALLVARHSGKCMDVTADVATEGGNVQLWTCEGRDSQKWSLMATDGGYYTIRDLSGNRCVEVVDGNKRSGANVQEWTCAAGARNQQWRLSQRDGGYFVLIARHSGKCLDVQEAGTENGTNIRQWACIRGRRNQEWRFA